MSQDYEVMVLSAWWGELGQQRTFKVRYHRNDLDIVSNWQFIDSV